MLNVLFTLRDHVCTFPFASLGNANLHTSSFLLTLIVERIFLCSEPCDISLNSTHIKASDKQDFDEGGRLLEARHFYPSNW